MKAGWQQKKLSEVCLIKPPKSEIKKLLNNSDLVSFAPMERLGINQKYFDAAQERPMAEVAGSYTYFANGDVLLAKITPCFENGKLGIAQGLTNGVGFGSSEYIVFRNNSDLNREFLYYFLSREIFREEGAKRMVGAVGHKRVSKEYIENTLIPIPPLSEQQRIVTILDEAFEGIATATANAEKNLRNACDIFERYRKFLFEQKHPNWKRLALGECAEVRSGGTPTVSNEKFWGGNIPWYSSGELNNIFTETSERCITKDGLAGSSTKLFPKGSLLIGMYDTAALKMSILDRDGAFNQAIAGVKPNSNIDLIFVLHAINAIKPFLLSQRRGVRQKNLSLTKIKEISLDVPSIAEQQNIVSKLDILSVEIGKVKSVYRQKLDALAELKKSILHQAFTGQLQ